MSDYEKLLNRIEELEKRLSANEVTIQKLSETNHHLANRVSELITIIANNGISLKSEKIEAINNADPKEVNQEIDDLDEQLDDLTNYQRGHDYSGYPYYKTDKNDNKIYAKEDEDGITLDVDYNNSSATDIDNTKENADEVVDIEDPDFQKLMAQIDKENAEKKGITSTNNQYFSAGSSDGDYDENAADREFGKGNDDSMIDVEGLDLSDDSIDEIKLDDTNNKYLGERVELNIDFESQKKEFSNSEKIDYKKTKGKKTFKVKKLRKAFNWERIKTGIKNHWKKVVAAALIGIATIAGVASCMNNNNDKVSSSIVQEIDSDIPSETKANEFELKKDDILNSLNPNQDKEDTNENSKFEESDPKTFDFKIEPSKEDDEVHPDYKGADNTYDVSLDNYNIGQDVEFNGDYIYQTSKDASSETNKLNPYYENSDQRSISAIEMVSPDESQHVTITEKNKNEQELLESMGWTVESYNVSNDTRDVEYEGWINNSDLEASNGNYR